MILIHVHNEIGIHSQKCRESRQHIESYKQLAAILALVETRCLR